MILSPGVTEERKIYHIGYAEIIDIIMRLKYT